MVTFHPTEPILRAAIAAAAQELDRLVVVDNSTNAEAQQLVDHVVLQSGVRMRDGRPPTVAERHGNVGLSRALNAGLRLGLQEGQELFLLLDQDSVLDPGAGAELANAYAKLARAFPTVKLSARNLETSPSRFQSLLEQVFYRSARADGTSPVQCPLAMTSGLLVSARVLRRTGFFDESFFLDAVDHEFCLRSWQHGIPLFAVPTATIRHSLGRPARSAWGPFSFELRHAEERRLFLSTRDTLRAVRRYWSLRPFICSTLAVFVGSRAVVYGLVGGKAPGGFRAIGDGVVAFLRSEDRPVIPQAV